MHTVRTDQQIALGGAAVIELDPHTGARVEHSDRAGVAPDAIGRNAFHQPVKQDSARNHPNGCPEPVDDRVTSSVASGRPVDVTTRTVDSR